MVWDWYLSNIIRINVTLTWNRITRRWIWIWNGWLLTVIVNIFGVTIFIVIVNLVLLNPSLLLTLNIVWLLNFVQLLSLVRLARRLIVCRYWILSGHFQIHLGLLILAGLQLVHTDNYVNQYHNTYDYEERVLQGVWYFNQEQTNEQKEKTSTYVVIQEHEVSSHLLSKRVW